MPRRHRPRRLRFANHVPTGCPGPEHRFPAAVIDCIGTRSPTRKSVECSDFMATPSKPAGSPSPAGQGRCRHALTLLPIRERFRGGMPVPCLWTRWFAKPSRPARRRERVAGRARPERRADQGATHIERGAMNTQHSQPPLNGVQTSGPLHQRLTPGIAGGPG
jgi:hypothetical protein